MDKETSSSVTKDTNGLGLIQLTREWLLHALSGMPVRVSIDFWGQEQICSNAQNDSNGQTLNIKLHTPTVLQKILIGRDPMAVVEAYLNEDLEFTGKVEDLVLVVEHLADVLSGGTIAHIRNYMEAVLIGPLRKSFQGLDLYERLNPHSLARDKAAVQEHYDAGNQFYRLWLDKQLVYSCAYFDQDGMSLDQAQESKLDLICRKLRLQPGDKMLDIGCGWGALLRWAATHYGAQVYGITLSQEQINWNRNWITKEGLENQIAVELADYRDLSPTSQFNKIVSVGMIEHVGIKNYPVYFRTLLSLLSPKGIFLNHGITTSTHWSNSGLAERFMRRYIFPDGELAELPTMLVEAKEAGWEIIDVESLRPHYAKTLRCWADNLEKSKEKAIELVGTQKTKLWWLYLAGSALAFHKNKLGVFQTLLRRVEDEIWDLPMNRKGWLS